MNRFLKARHAHYTAALVEDIIPFWNKHAVDRKHGGYFTSLDRDGTVYDTEKYMWMQWRIVYMFSELYLAGYAGKKELKQAQAGFDFLTTHGKDRKGNYYFALNGRGAPSVVPYSIFSECFAAMGSAALFKATGEARYRAEAQSAIRKYLRRMANPKLQWEKGLPGRPARLALGPDMILVNLGLLAQEYLDDDRYAADVRASVDRVLDRFWNPRYKVIFENVNTDGTFDFDSCDGRHINPGHGLETMWFIMQYAEKSGDKLLAKRAAAITAALLEFGWDREYGGIYYFMDVLNKPHLELQWDMKLWWVHCEALVASLYAWRVTGETRFMEWFKRIDRWTWKHFPDPDYGEWFGYLNRRGEPTHLLKGGKWKTFFHLPRALMMCMRLMEGAD